MTQPSAKTIYPRTLIVLIGLAAIGLGIANIIASNTVATTGRKLQGIEAQARELEAQSQELERFLAEKKSLNQVKARAESLGLLPITQIVSLTSAEPLAQLPGQ